MDFKGIIFDFNGTMLFDSDKHEEAWRLFVKEELGREISDEEFKYSVHGRINQVVLKNFFGEQISESEIKMLSDRKEAIYRELCLADLESFQLVKGLEEFLEELKRRDIPRTIATASGKENLDFYREYFHLDRWFMPEQIVYNDGTLLGKPNPDIYIKAARQIGCQPGECMVVEDALSGIESAYRAGVKTIIAMVPEGEQKNFESMKEVSGVITDFTLAVSWLH